VIPNGLKFALILTCSFLIILGLYEYLVRRRSALGSSLA